MRNLARTLAALTLLGAFLGACGGNGSSKGDKTPSNGITVIDDGAPATKQETILAQTDADGFLTKDAALELFASQYGDLPGVRVPKGPNGPASDGNLAIGSVFRFWDDLTEAQRVRVRELLDEPSDFTPSGRGRSRASDASAEYQRTAEALLVALEARLGPLGVPIQLTASDRTFRVDGVPALADTQLVDGVCRIRAYVRHLPPLAPVSETLIHELFHCFQQVWNNGRLFAPAGNWVTEGTAEWVGAVVTAQLGGQADRTATQWLGVWYRTARTELFRRSYDAFGFFQTAQQEGVDVFARMRSIVTAPNAAAAYAAVGVSGERWASNWATTQFNAPTFGDRWYLRGAGIPTIPSEGLARAVYSPFGNGSVGTIQSTPYATARGSFSLQADLTRFTSSDPTAGVARLGLGEDKPLSELRDGPYCTAQDSQRCVCPAGTRQAGRVFPSIRGGDTIIALGGADQAASVEIVGTSLEDECNRDRTCPVGRWKMNTPATGLPFSLSSGGVGKVLIIEPDGRLTQSFDEFVTARGTQRGFTFVLSATGAITAEITIPPGVEFPTDMRPRNVAAGGITGQFVLTSPEGDQNVITGPDFTAVVSALVTADPSRTATLSCRPDGTLTIDAPGGLSEVYSPA